MFGQQVPLLDQCSLPLEILPSPHPEAEVPQPTLLALTFSRFHENESNLNNAGRKSGG
jgi:hypothetical protein